MKTWLKIKYLYLTQGLLNGLVVLPIWFRLILKGKSLSSLSQVNSSFADSGMTHLSKWQVHQHLQENESLTVFLPDTIMLSGDMAITERIDAALTFIESYNLTFPVVLKPDSGSRSIGAFLVHDETALRKMLTHIDVDYLLQAFYFPGIELGLFYIRGIQGHPSVIAAGLRQPVVRQDITKGLFSLKQRYLYKNCTEKITDTCKQKIVAVMDQLDVNLGRIDVGGKDLDAVLSGEEDFIIYEVNLGVDTTALHAHDLTISLLERYRLLQQKWGMGLLHVLSKQKQQTHETKNFWSRYIEYGQHLRRVDQVAHRMDKS